MISTHCGGNARYYYCAENLRCYKSTSFGIRNTFDVVYRTRFVWYASHISGGIPHTFRVVYLTHFMWYTSHISYGIPQTFQVLYVTYFLWYSSHISCGIPHTFQVVQLTHYLKEGNYLDTPSPPPSPQLNDARSYQHILEQKSYVEEINEKLR